MNGYYAQDDDWDYDPMNNDERDDADPEPVGSCDECDGDLWPDDVYYYPGGERLCGRCSWIAEGCPEPGKETEE